MGRTQEWRQPAQVIRPGDVWCPPGVKHWHGAAPDTAMTHLAVTGTVDGRSVTWMEKVTDEHTTVEPPAMSDPLTARQQAIPLIASFMASSDMPRLNAALNQGLDAGLTISDAREILVQLYAYAGFPRSLNALGELLQVVEARRQRGIQDAPGREPSRPIPTGADLIAAGTANQTKISGAPARGPVSVRIALMTAIGVTNRDGDYNRTTEVHDWKRRGERLVRVSGLPYTIVRPGWFDYNKADEHQLVLLQGDRRHAGNPSDGVIARRQIAEVLVASLTSAESLRKTFELVATHGPAQHELDAVFAPLDADPPGAVDAVRDLPNMPLAEEPERVRRDLAAASSNPRNA